MGEVSASCPLIGKSVVPSSSVLGQIAPRPREWIWLAPFWWVSGWSSDYKAYVSTVHLRRAWWSHEDELNPNTAEMYVFFGLTWHHVQTPGLDVVLSRIVVKHRAGVCAPHTQIWRHRVKNRMRWHISDYISQEKQQQQKKGAQVRGAQELQISYPWKTQRVLEQLLQLF